MDNKKTFILYWIGSLEPEIIKGRCISDAFAKAGYSACALRALDYFEEVKPTFKKKDKK